MAIDSISVLTETGEGKAKLAEQYGFVAEKSATVGISEKLRNKKLVDVDFHAGTAVFRKFGFGVLQPYGTARASGAGQKVKAQTIRIDLKDDLEIIHEVEDADAKMLGVDGLLEQIVNDDAVVVGKGNEEAFWKAAANEGTKFIPSANATTLPKKIDEAIVKLETSKGLFVKGVSRDNMHLALSPAAYTELQEHIDTLPGVNGTTYEVFHKVPVESCVDLPDGVDFVIQKPGSVALGVFLIPVESGKIPMSNAYSFGFQIVRGAGATNPETIYWVGDYIPDGAPITFNIGETECSATQGMTWGEWVDSSYTLEGYYIDEAQSVRTKAQGWVMLEDGTRVKATDNIINAYTYHT